MKKNDEVRILFLHHSTGLHLWNGDNTSIFSRTLSKLNIGQGYFLRNKAELPKLFKEFNKSNNKNYIIENKVFPKESPYGWKNYPFDYYNIWVKNSGEPFFMEEPTLEFLERDYDVIIFKHCFPVCNIHPDQDEPNINSEYKSLSNYKLQYNALKKKLKQFPDTKFIVFTGAAQVKQNISEDEALRASEFFKWVINEWDEPNDNIFIWDLYRIQTEGDIYFKSSYAVSEKDSHPNNEFSGYATRLLFDRITDVIETNGEKTKPTGNFK